MAARQAPTPHLARLWRGCATRGRRWLHLLLLALTITGLTPLGEALELALAEAHPVDTSGVACGDDCDQGCDDAGCHGDLHHCGCCAPLPRLAASSGWSPSAPPEPADRHRPLPERGPPERAPPPPWQPPRA